MAHPFDYNLALSRNIGWFTEQEQQILRSKLRGLLAMLFFSLNKLYT